MPFGIGHWEIVALVVVLIVLFGSKQLPTLGRQLGRGVRDAGREVTDVKHALSAPAPDEKPDD